MDNHVEKNFSEENSSQSNASCQVPTEHEKQVINQGEDFSDSPILPEQLSEISNLKEQIEILQDKLLRTVAEAENTRKRLEKTIVETREYAIFSFAKDLLSVNDNLSRALEYKPQNIGEEVANIITGVEMTQNELMNILKKHAVEPIVPNLGDKFDYNIHHAISQIESKEHEADSIISVMQLGYKIKDRLLRPAAVQVTKLPVQ